MKRHYALCTGMGTAALLALSVGARADEKGEKTLREAFKTLGAAKAMTATFTQTLEGEGVPQKLSFKGTFSAMKPNYLLVKISGELPGDRKFERVYAATGKAYFSYNSLQNNYTRAKLDPKPTEFPGEWEGEIDAFFGGEKNLEKGEPTYAGTRKIGEVTCDVVKMKMKAAPPAPERTITYYIGQKDHLIYKASYLLPTEEGAEITQANILTDINLKASKKAEDFVWSPPRDAKERGVPRPPRDVILARSLPKKAIPGNF